VSAREIIAGSVAVLIAALSIWRRHTISGERKLLAGAAVFVLVVYATGALNALPDPKKAIGDIAETLGAWTYALVGVSAYL
jgi:peptidoglycan/LPS O-acetylase OafA/YrhL